MTALYFKERENFTRKDNMSKEELPPDWTEEEVSKAANIAGCAGYAIIENFGTKKPVLKSLRWFTN